MSEIPKKQFLLLFIGALLLLAVSWKFMLPSNTPTAVAPKGASPRMSDAP